VRLTDHELITIAFVPAGTKVPVTPTAEQLNRLTDVTPAATVPPATTSPEGASTTAPPAATTTAPTGTTSSPPAAGP
jgi:hypothetical protein